MKYFRSFLMAVVLALTTSLTAQSVDDIFTYHESGFHGTARYLGTGGSLMSLGADFSAVADNPAGAVNFLTNRITYSPGFYNKFNQINYGNKVSTTTDAGIYHSILFSDQFGFVMPYVSSENDWNKIAFGLNYQVNKNYWNNPGFEGESGTGKNMEDYFLWHAVGIPTGDLNVGLLESTEGVYRWLGENYGASAQHAFLAYQAYAINPLTDDDNNTDYVSNATFAGNPYHKVKRTTSGKKGALDFFFAAQYQKKLNVGIAYRNWHINYTENQHITESGYAQQSTLQSLDYFTRLHTEATGHQINFGLTYAPVKRIRLSVAYHSPVWWEINETASESISSVIKDNPDLDDDGDTDEFFSFSIDPQVTNSYAPYRMITPGKIMAGASVVAGKYGFVSFSYEWQDWSTIHLAPTADDNVSSEYFDDLNSKMASYFGPVQTLSVGGEFRIDKLMLRGGYRTSNSPVKGLKRQNRWLSYGVGYDFGSLEVDLGIVNGKTFRERRIMPVGLDNPYGISTRTNRYVVSIKFNY